MALELNKHNLCICPTKTTLSEYYNLLSRSKIVPTYIQHDLDSFSSRSLEAIAMGSFACVKSDNAINLFFDISSGLIEYDSNNISSIFNYVLENWFTLKKNAQKGQQIAISQFSFDVVVNQLFKYIAFQALDIDIKTRKNISSRESKFRLYSKIESDYICSDKFQYLDFKNNNAKMLYEFGKQTDDVCYLSGASYQYWSAGNHELSIYILIKAYEKHPNHIGLIFNLGYAFYNKQAYSESLHYFEILNLLDINCISIEPHFPIFDFDSSVFLGRIFRDEICHSLLDNNKLLCSINYIKSVAYNYLANIDITLKNYARAKLNYELSISIFSDNFIAKLQYATFIAYYYSDDLISINEAKKCISDVLDMYPAYYTNDDVINTYSKLFVGTNNIANKAQAINSIIFNTNIMETHHDAWRETFKKL
jgi:hypothetical protein